MTIEDELTRSLERQLGALDLGGADLPAARRAGVTLRRRRRLGAGAALAVLLVVVGGLALRPPGVRRAEPVGPGQVAPTPVGRWTQLPDPPGGARFGQVMAWTGTELVVVGGGTRPDADGTGASRTGAAYDPATGRWRRIADSPQTVPTGSSAYAVGRYVVVWADQRWLAYDSRDDSWRRLPAPPLTVSLAAGGGDRVFALDLIDRIVALDPAAGRWTIVPTGPSRDGLSAAATPQLTLAGFDGGVVVRGDDDRADVWDGRRWTSRTQPAPGYVVPTTGAWRRLPAPPRADGGVLPDSVWGVPVSATLQHLWDPRAGEWLYPGFPEATVEVSSERLWADGRLYQVGGQETDAQGVATDRLSAHAWVWTSGSR